MTSRSDDTEARRLEELWAGSFGDAYLARNLAAGAGRGEFWDSLLQAFPVRSVLEVGCSGGANLQWIAAKCEVAHGVDVSRRALEVLSRAVPAAKGFLAEAQSLPFPGAAYDLVFTAGVLIHQPESSLVRVMSELVRVSCRYVLSLEYAAAETEPVPYRGQDDALFRRNYETLYREWFPQLRLVKRGFLPASSGWDDVTWWLFEKPQQSSVAAQ